MKKPIRHSVSARLRPAIGVPTTTSSCPLSRASTTLKAARSVMNSVAPSAWPSAFAASDRRGGRVRLTVAPRNVWTVGRGRSVGTSSIGGLSWSCRLQ